MIIETGQRVYVDGEWAAIVRSAPDSVVVVEHTLSGQWFSVQAGRCWAEPKESLLDRVERDLEAISERQQRRVDAAAARKAKR